MIGLNKSKHQKQQLEFEKKPHRGGRWLLVVTGGPKCTHLCSADPYTLPRVVHASVVEFLIIPEWKARLVSSGSVLLISRVVWCRATDVIR